MTEWIEFEKLEPFGDEWRASAQIAQTVWNMNVREEHQRTVDSFMPLPPPEEAEERPLQTPEQQEIALAGYGIRVRKQHGHDHDPRH